MKKGKFKVTKDKFIASAVLVKDIKKEGLLKASFGTDDERFFKSMGWKLK